ncbi:hypothetical protein CcCBS67573_g09028 [Chytriomyces confervae]|uniref:Cyclic nucleotide-binding domain-containing protein n=1 Tax=Chytriomyces confervae TaxID=246404 RepID=A0A507E8W3_9FUNG|nr:hypothetical protein CcCBS67573_g09028 [Chytriomyces confervae]
MDATAADQSFHVLIADLQEAVSRCYFVISKCEGAITALRSHTGATAVFNPTIEDYSHDPKPGLGGGYGLKATSKSTINASHVNLGIRWTADDYAEVSTAGTQPKPIFAAGLKAAGSTMSSQYSLSDFSGSMARFPTLKDAINVKRGGTMLPSAKSRFTGVNNTGDSHSPAKPLVKKKSMHGPPKSALKEGNSSPNESVESRRTSSNARMSDYKGSFHSFDRRSHKSSIHRSSIQEMSLPVPNASSDSDEDHVSSGDSSHDSEVSSRLSTTEFIKKAEVVPSSFAKNAFKSRMHDVILDVESPIQSTSELNSKDSLRVESPSRNSSQRSPVPIRSLQRTFERQNNVQEDDAVPVMSSLTQNINMDHSHRSRIWEMGASQHLQHTANSKLSVAQSLKSEKNSFFAAMDKAKRPMNHTFLLQFLLPAYDNKGKPVTLEVFEPQDIENISFGVNGLHPKSHFNTIWDLVGVGLFLYFCWYIPIVICFNDDFSILDETKFSIAMSAIYVLDSIVFMLTPTPSLSSTLMYSFREYEAMRPNISDWVKECIKKNLLVEIVTSLPLDVFAAGWRFRNVLLLFRVFRLYRLPRMTSRCAYIKRSYLAFDAFLGMSLSKLFPYLIAMVYFIHLNACSMYYLGRETGFVAWDVQYLETEKHTFLDYYSFTLYHSIGNMFPLSFLPQTLIEQFVSVFFIFFAAVLYAMFVGAMSSATMSVNPGGRLYVQKMEELSDYVKWKNLSPATEEKLFRYFETKYRGKHFDEDQLLMEMNESLRAEISLQNTRALIEQVPFLRREEHDGRDEIFLGRLATALRAQYYVVGDFITKQGGTDMFFILSGKVDVIVNNRKVVTLFDGAYIGEVALITKVLRTATVQATNPSVLYRLTYHDFHVILEEFADMRAKIALLAAEREKTYVK